MKYLKVVLLFPFYFSASLHAQTIEEIFPYTVQSHDANGVVEMNSHSYVFGAGKYENSGEINFKSGSFHTGKKASQCYGYDCLTPQQFQATSSVDFSALKERNDIDILTSGSVTVKNKNIEGDKEDVVYIIEGDLEVKNGGQFGVAQHGALVFVSGDVDIKGQFYGYLYSEGKVKVQTPGVAVCGSVSTKDLELKGNAGIDGNQCTYDFGWFDEKEESEDIDKELAGYVGTSSKSAGIRIDDEKLNGLSLIIEKVKGEDDNKSAELRDQNGNLLKEGDKFTFPNTLYYNRVGDLEFDLEEADDKEQDIDIELDLIYVPYKLTWVTEVKEGYCSGPKGFVYETHENTCPVIGEAGEKLSLKLQAYDADGKPLKDNDIDDLDIDIDCAEKDEPGCIEIRELNANGNIIRKFEQAEVEFDDQGYVVFTTNGEGEDEGNIKNVALIEAVVSKTCADDPDDDCALLINGDTAILGRTVPNRLLITAGSGKLENGIAYRGKKLAYHQDDENEPPQSPYFSVMACAAGQKDDKCDLPSYTGQFAGGMDLYASLTQELLGNELVWIRQDDGTGEHIWKPEESFAFDKDGPVAEQSLHIPLKLTLAAHDLLDEITATAHFTGENDTLRFGFVTLLDTEIEVGEEGKMFSKLHYYGETLNSLKEDSSTDYDLSEGSKLQATLPGDNPVESLTLTATGKGIDVDPYGSEQKGIEVTIQGLPDWLRPADADNTGELTDPSAILDIVKTLRRRASDRTFNRREVTR